MPEQNTKLVYNRNTSFGGILSTIVLPFFFKLCNGNLVVILGGFLNSEDLGLLL